MSDNQFASMTKTDGAHTESTTSYELAKALEDILAYKHITNVHQGRAREHLLAEVFTKPSGAIPTKHHFTTTKA